MSKIFAWIGGLKIWLIIGGILTAVFSYLVLRLKYLKRKNEKLEHDEKINDEIKAIHEQQEEDTDEVLKNEQREIEKEIESLDPVSKRDRFKRL
mgnify:CR=1 FL=1